MLQSFQIQLGTDFHSRSSGQEIHFDVRIAHSVLILGLEVTSLNDMDVQRAIVRVETQLKLSTEIQYFGLVSFFLYSTIEYFIVTVLSLN